MKAAAILLALSLAGCASAPVVRTERVEVPVSVPCKAQPVKEPDWAVDALLRKGVRPTLYQRSQAMAVEIEQRREHETKLRAAVSACQ